MKECKKCKIPKDIHDFGKIKKAKDGLDKYCKICRYTYYKEKQYDRKQYQSSYERKITDERKLYLKEYFKINKKTRIISRLIHRTLNYKNEEKLKESKNYLGWTKECFANKFGTIPENYHIDHKIPVTWFLKCTPVCVINNLENIQLLSQTENVKKGNRFSHAVPYSYYKEAKNFISKVYINKVIYE